jgi:hypothetical protein
MSTPNFLAETDAKIIVSVILTKHVDYILKTALANSDRIK